jgi:hypothetical protein
MSSFFVIYTLCFTLSLQIKVPPLSYMRTCPIIWFEPLAHRFANFRTAMCSGAAVMKSPHEMRRLSISSRFYLEAGGTEHRTSMPTRSGVDINAVGLAVETLLGLFAHTALYEAKKLRCAQYVT